jgi:Integrase zinc binding domain
MLHYAQFLSGFDYEIRYRKTGDYSNADFLSRFPIEKTRPSVDEVAVFQLRQIETLPITKQQLQTETRKDPELRDLFNSLIAGNSTSDYNLHYSVHDGCLMYGIRVVIPTSLRASVLDELHIGHMGISKMKSLARSYCYWRNIDADIEQMVKACRSCCTTQNNARKKSVGESSC